MRLKNRQHAVPRGFRFIWAATGWNAQKLMPHRSFNDVVMALQSNVKGNPHQAAQSGMPADYDSLALRVEEQTVKELMHEGFTDFVQQDAILPKWMPPQPLADRQAAPSVVGASAKTIAGVATYLDWLGDGGKPVPAPQAEARGSVCVRCPFNAKGDWKTKFTEMAAAGITKVFGMMNDLELKTSHDEKLGVCDVCLCALKSKVWAPLPHILKHMSEKTKAALWPQCWITNEKP